jgi:hypothetical protein
VLSVRWDLNFEILFKQVSQLKLLMLAAIFLNIQNPRLTSGLYGIENFIIFCSGVSKHIQMWPRKVIIEE